MLCKQCGMILDRRGNCPNCGAYQAPEGTQLDALCEGSEGGSGLSGKRNTLVVWAVAVPALLLMWFLIVYPLFTTFLLSVKEYSPALGLFGSPFVGMQNFKELFASQVFLTIFSNTLFYGVCTLVFGGAYVFGATYGVRCIKNSWLKCAVLCALLLPVFVPSTLAAKLLLPHAWANQAQLYRIGPVLNEVFFIAPAVVLAGAFMEKQVSPRRCALFTAGCYVCLHLILLLSPDMNYIMQSYSPLTYQTADVFDTYAYRKGYLQSDYCYGAAIYCVKFALQLVPAIIGTVGLILLANGRKNRLPDAQTKTGAGAVTAAVLGMVGILLVVHIAVALKNAYPFENVIWSGQFDIYKALIICVGGWIAATVVALGLACVMSGGGKVSRTVMLCLAALFLMGVSNTVGRYVYTLANEILRTSAVRFVQYGTYGILIAYLLFIASKDWRGDTVKDWFRHILAPGAALSGVVFIKIYRDIFFPHVLYMGERQGITVIAGCLTPVIVGVACIWLGGYLQNRAARKDL